MSVTSARPRPRKGRDRDAPDEKRSAASPLRHVHGPQSPEEVAIGVALTTQWMLTTGRRLGQEPLLHDLAADQLIDFWADDHSG